MGFYVAIRGTTASAKKIWALEVGDGAPCVMEGGRGVEENERCKVRAKREKGVDGLSGGCDDETGR